MYTLKRKCDHSFEYSEKTLLVSLVTNHFKVIESKKTDSVNIKMKNAEWVKIAEEFAAGSSIYSRDSCSLKMLWENLKRKAKLVIAAQADNQYGTGGGKAKNILSDPLVDTVISLIRPHVEPFKNPYDDNDDIMSQSGIYDFDENIVEEVVDMSDKGIDSHNISYDWSEYNSTMIKAPISAALRQPLLPTLLPQLSTSSLPSTSKAADLKLATAQAVSPLQVSATNKKASSRRRPVLGTSASDTLIETKVSLLNSASADSKEEHELQMDILQLQKKQEEEKLKQEKMKTALLKFQLERETGVEFDVDKII